MHIFNNVKQLLHCKFPCFHKKKTTLYHFGSAKRFSTCDPLIQREITPNIFHIFSFFIYIYISLLGWTSS